MNLKTLDLNLLIALDALIEEKHVTRAADRISLSQPAMSRALARLRDMFQDPLLVKGKKGMVLTARAIELHQPLQTIINELTNMISPPSIDPMMMQGEIVIATRDNELVTILPKIISRVTAEAPKLNLTIVPLLGDNLTVLEHHQADFVLAATDSESSSLHRYTLYEEDFVCLVSKKNPVIQQELSLKIYVEMKHCLVTISGFGLGVVDTLLAKKKLKRNIAIRIPHFLAAAHIVADSDLIVTVPRRLGMLFAQQKKITLLEPPLKIPKFPIYLYWHARDHNNPVHMWLRKIIQANFNLGVIPQKMRQLID